MKRRAFLKGLTAFLVAPLAVFGAKKAVKPSLYILGEQTIETDGGFGMPPDYLTDSDLWFLKEPRMIDKRKLWKLPTTT